MYGTQWLETRLVVLPRFQGIGIGTKLPELVAAQCGAYGLRLMFKTSQELQLPELVAAQCGAYGLRLMFKTSQELQAPPYNLFGDMRVAAVCETDPGYIGHTWYNGVALCGTPAACILAAAATARMWSWWPSQGVKKR